MSYASQTLNITAEQRYQGLLERVVFSMLIGMPCCLFLFINGIMLFTLRSKTVFRETCRYILLYNLLFADTVMLGLSQLLYILSVSRIFPVYPVCGVLIMLTSLTNEISPLTLVVMCLERYVAVCYPLRHATIITIRNTAVAIIVVWAFSSLNVLIRVLLLLKFPFEELPSLQMTDVCSDIAMFLGHNLLFADTVLLALSQLLYIMAAFRIFTTYPVCGVLAMLNKLTNEISPLTLVVMSLERYVAVCYPLRHATIITVRNTAVAIIVVWAFSSLNVLIQVILLLKFPFEKLPSLQMTDICAYVAMFLMPMSDIYDKAYTGFVFVSAGVTVTCSYIGVMVAARSASTDKASARKARNTLLLHLVQLGLSLLSTMHSSIIVSLSRILQRLLIVRIRSTFYVFIYILPRCLSSLIYGLRDQTIRPVLMYHLCCRLKLSHLSKGRGPTKSHS